MVVFQSQWKRRKQYLITYLKIGKWSLSFDIKPDPKLSISNQRNGTPNEQYSKIKGMKDIKGWRDYFSYLKIVLLIATRWRDESRIEKGAAKSNLSLSLSLFPSLPRFSLSLSSRSPVLPRQPETRTSVGVSRLTCDGSPSNKPRVIWCTITCIDVSLHITTSILLRALNSFLTPQVHDRTFLYNVSLLVFYVILYPFYQVCPGRKYVVNSSWIISHSFTREIFKS